MYTGSKIVTDQLVWCADADSNLMSPGVNDAYDIAGRALNTDDGSGFTRVPDGFYFDDTKGIEWAHNSDWQLDDVFSMEVMFKSNTTAQSSYAGLLAKDSGGSFGAGVMCMAQTAGYIRFGFNDGSGNSEISNPSYNDMETSGVWFHYVGTYDGAVMKLYRNGVEIATDNFTGSGQEQESAVTLGGRTVGVQYTFEGNIKFARIYKKGLSAEEVQINYKQALTRI